MRTIWLLGAMLAVATAARAQDAPTHYVLEGTLGPYPVGADLVVADDHRTIGDASYFYVSKGKDIPLTAETSGETMTLREPDGGTFTLRFRSNGSAKPPFDFRTSVALVGTWRSGETVQPVTLDFGEIRAIPPGTRWYASMASTSDVEVEATARRFLRAAVAGDKAAVAAAVTYPLRVNGKSRTIVRNRVQLLRRWNAIFTPSYVAKLRTASWHKMFVHDGNAMAASGAVWFDAKGAVALNIVDP